MLSRRNFGKQLAAAAATLPASALWAKPDSRFHGVNIGVITYSFRELPSGAAEVLKYCVDCGISGVELMSNVAESYAGAPLPAGPGFVPGGPRPPQLPLTPDQREAMRETMRKQAAEMSKWRLAASMDKYKAFRKMYADAGVKIYAFKLPPAVDMPDAEYEYIWNVAETLGANHITMELPTDDKLLQRVADYAARRQLAIAFHTHGQGGASGFEKVLAASPYTALNFDVGHYFGVNGESPVPLIEKYHARIASLHLKDRKGPASAPQTSPGAGRGGPNMPWGQGETPLKEILQTMKRNKYKFPASIEYEYQTPAGSDVLTEVKKCVEFCRNALA